MLSFKYVLPQSWQWGRAPSFLYRAGVTPDQVSLRKPTLDEVFLNLTGHPAGAS